jgi:hypothetical protein
VSLENTSQSATIEVGGIEMPHGKLAREAYETTRALLPDVLNNHAQRVYVFAALAAKRRAIQLDGELLYVAARFSNVGLAAAYADSKRRYEVDSADAILAFLGRNHVADAIAQEAWHRLPLAYVLTCSEMTEQRCPGSRNRRSSILFRVERNLRSVSLTLLDRALHTDLLRRSDRSMETS